MRVGLILGQRLGRTGSGVYSLNLAGGLRHIGVDVSMMAAGPSVEDGGERAAGTYEVPLEVPFEDGSFPIAGMSDVMPYRTSVFSELGSDAIDAYVAHWERHVRAFCEAGRFDVVHVNHFWIAAAVAMDWGGAPVVITLHGTDIEQWEKCPWIVERMRLPQTAPTVVHSVSPKLVARAREVGLPGADATVTVPPPYREDIFAIDAAAGTDPMLALFVGKLSERKGMVELLRAFAQVREQWPGAKAAVAGESPGGVERWKSMATELEIPLSCIEFLGFLDQETLAGWYRRARMLVVPSWDEGYSLVAVEAAACGTDVLMPRYGAADEILKDVVPEGRLHIVPMLGLPTLEARQRYVDNLADEWRSLLETTPGAPVAGVDETLAELGGCDGVARKMVKEVYGRATE